MTINFTAFYLPISNVQQTLLSFPTASFVYVYGGSNFSLSRYQEYNKLDPRPPYSSDEFSLRRYKSEVKNYVKEAKEYVDNAENDIKRIREAQQEAIDKANRVVNEYNRR